MTPKQDKSTEMPPEKEKVTQVNEKITEKEGAKSGLTINFGDFKPQNTQKRKREKIGKGGAWAIDFKGFKRI